MESEGRSVTVGDFESARRKTEKPNWTLLNCFGRETSSLERDPIVGCESLLTRQGVQRKPRKQGEIQRVDEVQRRELGEDSWMMQDPWNKTPTRSPQGVRTRRKLERKRKRERDRD